MSKLEVIRDLDIFDSAVELVLDNHDVSDEVAKEIVEELYKTHKVDDVEIYSSEYANLLNKVDDDIETHSFMFESFEDVEKHKKEHHKDTYREYVLTEGWLLVLEVE